MKNGKELIKLTVLSFYTFSVLSIINKIVKSVEIMYVHTADPIWTSTYSESIGHEG